MDMRGKCYIFCTVAYKVLIMLSFVLQKNHIYTSGASGTNAAVIRGALRAERPELLTVILPQSLQKQPPESQDLLSKVIEWSVHQYIFSENRCNPELFSGVWSLISSFILSTLDEDLSLWLPSLQLK